LIHAGAERRENEAAWAGQLLAAEVKRLGWPAAELAAPRLGREYLPQKITQEKDREFKPRNTRNTRKPTEFALSSFILHHPSFPRAGDSILARLASG